MQNQTFNISLPRALAKKADSLAKKEYRTRSELIREALRAYLKNIEEWEALFRFGEKQGQKLGIKSEADVNKLVAKYRQGR